ncbi:hypothetical protein D187_010474 [Cystobacter fuscus DSM 2262]|uniref:Uncharacterized protein n=2 Tax=Cystobacter fuscus TaxID=43 RepID=S9PBR8_CYSF2|nr:hypothetical protein D187_010474 [Cystobacter fuscus DSM 2262]
MSHLPRMRRTLLILSMLSLLALGGAGWVQTRSLGDNPLSRHALAPSDQMRLTGFVEERLPAGSYLYLRVRTPDGSRHWVATLSTAASRESAVQVQVFARADDFHSRRLGRDFSPLLFGSVQAAPSASR